jgi:hypothetical protein
MAHEEGYALLTLYKNLYRDRYGATLTINKHALKWGATSVIEDYGFERCVAVAKFYLAHASNPKNVQLLFSKFHDFDEQLAKYDDSVESRRVQREKMYKTMREEGYVSEE